MDSIQNCWADGATWDGFKGFMSEYSNVPNEPVLAVSGNAYRVFVASVVKIGVDIGEAPDLRCFWNRNLNGDYLPRVTWEILNLWRLWPARFAATARQTDTLIRRAFHRLVPAYLAGDELIIWSRFEWISVALLKPLLRGGIK